MNLLIFNALSWEQRKLSNIADIVGGGTPSTSNPDYWDGDIDWYTPAEIGEQIFAYGSVRKITKEGLIHSSAKILPAHKTVLFTSRAGIGNMAILKRPAATNQGFQSLVCHDDIDPYFMFSMGDSIKAKAERVAAGSTFAEISGKKLGELEFMFPDTDEQKAIGAYFKNLDYLITLHQSKAESWKNKENQLSTISWEQRKVSDVVGITYGGGTPATSNEEYWKGDIPWIQSSNAVEDQLFDIDVKKHISKDGLTHSAAQLIPENSVAVVTHVGVGKLVFVPYSYTTSQDFISLSDLKCDPKFLCYALYKKLQEDLHIVQGSAIKGITKEDLMGKRFFLPRIDEQRKIADTLLSLDHLITLHHRKLNRTQICINRSFLYGSF